MQRNSRLARNASAGNVVWKLLLIILLLLILAGASGMTEVLFGTPVTLAMGPAGCAPPVAW